MKTEKLQKILANAGLGSRREIETWIADGRVTVNGKTAKLGDRADASSKICIDDQPIKLNTSNHTKTLVILYNKPLGEICTRSDPEGRKTVFDNLPPLPNGRWIAVGRLDISTSGLLLFTNNGELANALMHPSSEIEREYAVRALGEIDEHALEKLKSGVILEDGPARCVDIQPTGGTGFNQWYQITLKEGRNREVRRLLESQGVRVNRLIRIRFAHIRLPRDLKPVEWQALNKTDVNRLMHYIK